MSASYLEFVSPVVQFALFYTHTRVSKCCKFILHVGFLSRKAALHRDIKKWTPVLTKSAYLPPSEPNVCQKLRIFYFKIN
jgi:hypothetical protein